MLLRKDPAVLPPAEYKVPLRSRVRLWLAREVFCLRAYFDRQGRGDDGEVARNNPRKKDHDDENEDEGADDDDEGANDDDAPEPTTKKGPERYELMAHR